MVDLLEHFISIMSEARAEIQRLEYEVKVLRGELEEPLVDRVCSDKTQVFDRAELNRKAAAYRIRGRF